MTRVPIAAVAAFFLSSCGGPGEGARKAPLFVSDGIQGDDCVFLEAGLSLRRPGEGWEFVPGEPCVLSGPGGVTILLEAGAAPEGVPVIPDPLEWAARLEDLRSQGFEVSAGDWESGDPPAQGKILSAWKKNARGHFHGVCEAQGLSGKAKVRLYARGLWASARPPTLEGGEARLLLDKAHREFLERFEPSSPMAVGEESLLIQALLGRWVSALNRADPRAYLGCFHAESPALVLEKEMIQKRTGNLFMKDFGEDRPGPWAAVRESLIVDGGEAVMIVKLARNSKEGRPLQELRLKGRLRREAAAWKILLWEAMP